MLENTERMLQIDLSTHKEVEFLFLVFKSYSTKKVRIEALLYKDAEHFLREDSDGIIYIADIEYNINDGGLLEIGEQLAMEKYPTLIKCDTLHNPKVSIDAVTPAADKSNSPSMLSKMVGFLGFNNGIR